MAKRIKVIDKPKDYTTARYIGGLARDEGHPIDYIECILLRDPQAQAAWREGWQAMDKAKREQKGKQNV